MFMIILFTQSPDTEFLYEEYIRMNMYSTSLILLIYKAEVKLDYPLNIGYFYYQMLNILSKMLKQVIRSVCFVLN